MTKLEMLKLELEAVKEVKLELELAWRVSQGRVSDKQVRDTVIKLIDLYSSIGSSSGEYIKELEQVLEVEQVKDAA